MPRKNSEDEVKVDDTAGPVSQIRRSSRIAQNSPTPMSVSGRRTSVSSTDSLKGKSADTEIGTPSKISSASRSSSKSPTLLAKENEQKQSTATPSKIRGRRSSASKIHDADKRLDTPNPKNLRGRRRSTSSSSSPGKEQEKKEPAKTRGRNSETKKILVLEAIKERETSTSKVALEETGTSDKETKPAVKRKLDINVLDVIEEQTNMSDSESPVKKVVVATPKMSEDVESKSGVDEISKTSIEDKTKPILKENGSKSNEKTESNLVEEKDSEAKSTPSKSQLPNGKPAAKAVLNEKTSEECKSKMNTSPSPAKSPSRSQKTSTIITGNESTKTLTPKKLKTDDSPLSEDNTQSKMTRSKLALLKKKEEEERKVEIQKEEVAHSSKSPKNSPRKSASPKKKDLPKEEKKPEKQVELEKNDSSSKILEQDTISENELVVNDFKMPVIEVISHKSDQPIKESDPDEKKSDEPIEKSDHDIQNVDQSIEISDHSAEKYSETSDTSFNLQLSVSQIESLESLSKSAIEGITPKKQSSNTNTEKKTKSLAASTLVVEVEEWPKEIITNLCTSQKLSVNIGPKIDHDDSLNKEKIEDDNKEMLTEVADDNSSIACKTNSIKKVVETPTQNVPTPKQPESSGSSDLEKKSDEVVVESIETTLKSPSEKVSSTSEAKIDCEASNDSNDKKLIPEENIQNEACSSNQILSKSNLDVETASSSNKTAKSELNDSKMSSKLAALESFTTDEVEESLQEAFSTKRTISTSFDCKLKKETSINTSVLVSDENVEDIAAKLEDLLEEGGKKNTSKLNDSSKKPVDTKDDFEDENGSTEDMLSSFVDKLNVTEGNLNDDTEKLDIDKLKSETDKKQSEDNEDANFDFDADTDDNISTKKSGEIVQTNSSTTGESPKRNLRKRKRSSKKSFSENEGSFKGDFEDSDLEKTKDVLIEDIKTQLGSEDLGNSEKKVKKTPKKQDENSKGASKTADKSLQEDKSSRYDDDKLSDAINKLIANKSCSFDTSSSESECDNGYSYLDNMAEEVEDEEDAPTVGSNDIIDEGESLHSTDTEINSNDSYAKDSFIDDENEGNVELLSGEEYDLDLEKTSKKKKRYTYQISDSSDDSVEEIKISSSDSESKKDEIVAKENICKQTEVETEQNIIEAKIEPEDITGNIIDLTSFEAQDSNKRISIQENIKVQDIEDGQLSDRISKVVDWFYAGIRNSGNSLSGNVSLSVSLDYDNSTFVKPNDEPFAISQSKEENAEIIASSFQPIKQESTPKVQRKTLNLSQEAKTSPIHERSFGITKISKNKKRTSTDADHNKSESKIKKDSFIDTSQKSNASCSGKILLEKQKVDETNISRISDKGSKMKRKSRNDSVSDVELEPQHISKNKLKRGKKTADNFDVSNNLLPKVDIPKSNVKIQQKDKKRSESKENLVNVKFNKNKSSSSDFNQIKSSRSSNSKTQDFVEEICDRSYLNLGDVNISQIKVSRAETSEKTSPVPKLKKKKLAKGYMNEPEPQKISKLLKKKKNLQDENYEQDELKSPRIKKAKYNNSMEEAFEKHLKRKLSATESEAGPSNIQKVKAPKTSNKIKHFPKALLEEIEDPKPYVTTKLKKKDALKLKIEQHGWKVLVARVKPSKRNKLVKCEFLDKNNPNYYDTSSEEMYTDFKSKLLFKSSHIKRIDTKKFLKKKQKINKY